MIICRLSIEPATVPRVLARAWVYAIAVMVLVKVAVAARVVITVLVAPGLALVVAQFGVNGRIT